MRKDRITTPLRKKSSSSKSSKWSKQSIKANFQPEVLKLHFSRLVLVESQNVYISDTLLWHLLPPKICACMQFMHVVCMQICSFELHTYKGCMHALGKALMRAREAYTLYTHACIFTNTLVPIVLITWNCFSISNYMQCILVSIIIKLISFFRLISKKLHISLVQ